MASRHPGQVVAFSAVRAITDRSSSLVTGPSAETSLRPAHFLLRDPEMPVAREILRAGHLSPKKELPLEYLESGQHSTGRRESCSAAARERGFRARHAPLVGCASRLDNPAKGRIRRGDVC